LNLIKTNAFTFNDPKKALVCNHVTIVIESIVNWLEGKTKSVSVFSTNNSNNHNNQNITRPKRNIGDKKKKEMNESEDEENDFVPQKEILQTTTESKTNGRVTRSKKTSSLNKN
jgi:hypothetical protein